MNRHNSITSGGRTRRILDRARRNPAFRNKVVTLGALCDQMTYPTVESLMQFSPQMLELAGEADLLEGIDQAALDELTEWISDSANELAYLVSPHQRMPASPKFEEPVGHVFVSWTVKNPRDREAIRGVKAALDWFNIEYFDYTEHQLDDESDMSGQIVSQLENAISKSRFSVEVVSTEAGRPWVQFERAIIARHASIRRFFICLEWEKVQFVRMSEELEARVTRVDFSGGRMGVIPGGKSVQWAKQAADTRYFATADFFYRCYEIGDVVRALLSGRPKRHPLFSFLDAYRFNVMCQELRQSERQAMAIRTGLNCQPARLDDLLFPVPIQWKHRKKSTGHWIFRPVGVRRDIVVNTMFFNVGQQGMDTAAELMQEMEAKAMERRWTLTIKGARQITADVEGIDVVAEARNGVTHRFINFCYNRLEYFIEIKADTLRSLSIAKPVFDAWLDAFQLRPIRGQKAQ